MLYHGGNAVRGHVSAKGWRNEAKRDRCG
jgi:hypothetical protein